MPTWLVEEVVPITWAAVIIGGAVGAISHVLLDAILGSAQGETYARMAEECAEGASLQPGLMEAGISEEVENCYGNSLSGARRRLT